MSVYEVFDRVVVINLQRRTDRRVQFVSQLEKGWPFRTPEFMKAIDGERVVAPAGYSAMRHMWACFQSHRRVLEDTINDGLDSVLVVEDDALLCEGFFEKATKFMSEIPKDWELALFGGNHHNVMPLPVSDGIWKPMCFDRTHCYAVRGAGLINLYQFWHQWHTTPPDVALTGWIEYQTAYCAEPWLVGQSAGTSDVERVTPFAPPGVVPERFWQRDLMAKINGYFEK